MRFREIFGFELRYQAGNITTWLIFGAMLGLSFLITRDGSLAEALHDDFYVNSPFSIAKTTVAGSLIWLLMAAGITGEAAARDVATGMHPLTYTSGISKLSYLAGRYLAACSINACLLLAVPAGTMLAVYLPGVDPSLIGPFRPAAYLTAYCYIALPNAFAATALQFGIAAQSGRPMASYLGSVVLFFMSYIVGLFLLFQGRQELANYLDPIGVHFVLSELSHLWTPIEKSHRIITLEGTVLTNRLIWISVAIMVLSLTYMRFRFMHRIALAPMTLLKKFIHVIIPSKIFKLISRTDHPSILNSRTLPVSSKPVLSTSSDAQSFGMIFHLRQAVALAWSSFVSMARSWAGLFTLVIIPLLSVLVIMDQMEMNGVPLVPKTGRVLAELTAPLVADMSRWVIVPVLIIFFAGNIVWRERDAGLGEIIDAMPGSEWTRFAGKFMALSFLLTLFIVCLMVAGMIAQLLMNYQHVEPGLYLQILFGLQLPEYLLFGLLALVIHLVIDQKYIGHLVSILAWVLIALAPMFGIEHDLLIFGAGPCWSYTEMSGFGTSLAPWFWFKLYWAAWSLLLAVIACIMLVRGREVAISQRLVLAQKRLTRGTIGVAIFGIISILAIGGFIFHNTNVMNEYLTRAQTTVTLASYEQRYGRYAGVVQPTLTATSLRVELYPDEHKADIHGSYTLVNRSTTVIDTIHLSTAPTVHTGPVNFDRKSKLLLEDELLGHRMYLLQEPLVPGDSLEARFVVHKQPHGFKESGVDGAIVANGTYFTNRDWLPLIGYQRSRELTSASDRRKHGLPARPLIASLYDTMARKERGSSVTFEAVIGTSGDQVAVAPGVLQRKWTANGRNYFHYVGDKPIGTENHFFSARYQLRETDWIDTSGTGKAVAIRIYHHPEHRSHIDRMMRSIKASLDYYTKEFGPYQHSQVVFVEQPGDGDGAGIHAVEGMLIYEEGFTLWNPRHEPGSLDHPYAVVAHEMAHQWTVPYASVEGAPVVSESLAWYYGMKAVQHSSGQEQLDGLLRFMHQPHPYPPIRRGEPLIRGLDPYLSYRKGPFALYTLSEYIGEDKVNAALRRFVAKHFAEDAPLATTLDLYDQLSKSTPDSLKSLLHDLFAVNTFWELKTEKVATVEKYKDRWEVTINLRSRKIVVDIAGIEKEVPMNEWIEIGVYAVRGQDDPPRPPAYLVKHRIHSGRQTVIVTVPFKATAAGVDPRYLMPDLETDDNIGRINYLK